MTVSTSEEAKEQFLDEPELGLWECCGGHSRSQTSRLCLKLCPCREELMTRAPDIPLQSLDSIAVQAEPGQELRRRGQLFSDTWD
jgi:hypothetical protein